MASKNTKKQQQQTTKNTASLFKASNLDLTKSLSALSTSGVSIQSTLAKISEELITKHSELQAIDDAIKLKKEEMTALHGADQVLLNIDELKAQHAQQIEDMSKDRDALLAQFEETQAKLEIDRNREEETFTYAKQQQRKAELDHYNEQVRIRTNAERDRQEAFEKNVATREEALKLKETSYNDALTKITTFDAEVKKLADRDTAIALNSLKKDFTHQQELVSIQNKAEVEKLRYDNARLVEAANNYEIQLKDLQAQLKEAYAANSALAAKAVEGASNKQAQADALALVTNIGGNGQQRPRS